MDLKARCAYLRNRACRQMLVGQADTHTHLNRCLSTLQMTAIGLGSTIGVGIYVLLGVAIKEYAGPGVLLSFMFAGLVVLTNAMIFAEFGSYIPHTGAAYTYVYCVLGELAAFLTGWMGTLSLLCSAATGARAWSGFVDSLFNNTIQNFFNEKIGQIDIGPPFSCSLDVVAFGFFLLVTLIVSCNVHCSSIINTVLAILTTGVLVFVTIAGPIYGDISRVANTDDGGFLPFGMDGVIAGASAAFFAFSGFDSICISAEEAKNPVKSVPRAIMIELVIVTIVYCGAAVGTLSLIPFQDIDIRAPIPSAFEYQGVMWARLVVTLGPLIAITNINILALYSQSRIAYKMAKDGLIFSKFAYINPRTKVPLLGVIVFGTLASVISLFLELKDLVRFTVLCMLFQYIILAPALVALRISRNNAPADSNNGKRAETGSSPDEDYMLGSITVPEPSGNHSSNVLRNHNSDSDDGLVQSLDNRGPRSDYRDVAQHLRDPLTVYSYAAEGDLGCGSSTQRQALVADSGLVVAGGPGDGSNFMVTDSFGRVRNGGNNNPHNTDLLVDFATADNDAQPPSNTSERSGAFSTKEDGKGIYGRSDNADVTRGGNNCENIAQTNHTQQNNLGYDSGLPTANRTQPSLSVSESDISDAELFLARRPQAAARNSVDLVLKRGGESAGGVVQGAGCLHNTVLIFFRDFLSTRLCLVLLMVLLVGLSLQLGLGWEDLRRLRPLSIFTTASILAVIVFLCEVLRERCGPGSDQGFKVPLVPYLPAASAFLNMLLLVSAADVMGIIEFIVLIALGLVIYMVMVMAQWRRGGGDLASAPLINQLEESVSLLDHNSDADSEESL